MTTQRTASVPAQDTTETAAIGFGPAAETTTRQQDTVLTRNWDAEARAAIARRTANGPGYSEHNCN